MRAHCAHVRCVRVRVFVCIGECVCREYVRACIFVYMSVCVSVCTCACIVRRASVFVYVCTYVYVCMCMCLCAHHHTSNTRSAHAPDKKVVQKIENLLLTDSRGKVF